MPADTERAGSSTATTDEPPYIVDTDLVSSRCDGKTMNITIKTGTRQTLRLDMEKMKQLAQSSNLEDFRMPEEVILEREDSPSCSYHGPYGEEVSKEEYERLEALERYHEERGTLHLLYPEEYSEGYALEYDNDDDDEEDEAGSIDVEKLHESIRAVLVDEDLQPADEEANDLKRLND